jgi:hypothetical protein
MLHAAKPSSFEWKRPMEAPSVAGQWYRAVVPFDVVSRAYAFPDDLRIVDDQGRQWPFFIESPPARTYARDVKADVINRAWVEGDDSYLRLDFRIGPQAFGQPRQGHNQIHLVTSGSEFIRRVEVYGSEDKQTWALLGKGYLLRVGQPRPMTEERIQYGWSDYPHVQVRMYPHARNAMETFTCERATISALTDQELPLRVIPHRVVAVEKADYTPNAQSVVVDLEFARLPLVSVRLRAGDGDYFRRVVVSVRDAAKEPWRLAGAGDMYRMGASVKDEVSMTSRGRFVKCDVYHFDDAPLNVEVLEVFTERTTLIVEALADGNATLYYGGEFVDAPRFDLKQRVAQQSDTPFFPASFGAAVANPRFEKAGYGAWGKPLALAGVAVSSLIVLWVIVRMFKRGLPVE